MRDFEESTLWRVSEFERVRNESGTSGFARLDGHTVLPTTLLADLRQADAGPAHADALEVAAACIRHREPALMCLQHDGLVWPVTLFPAQQVYHSPADPSPLLAAGLAGITVVAVEPPGVRPPGHWMHERIANAAHYRSLWPLLWAMALVGPRAALLTEIAGTAAYRATRSPEEDGLLAPGAMGSAAERLRRETVSLRTIAGWPGMSLERASRLLNGLYLVSALLTTRGHPAARGEPRTLRVLLGGAKSRR